MSDLHPYPGLAATNPGRTARFRWAGLLIALTWTPSQEWQVRVWGPKGVSRDQLEGIATALELDFWTVDSYLSADFTTYVYEIRGGRHLSPELRYEYERILDERRRDLAPNSSV